MALVSTSPPLSAPLYPHAAPIYSHPPIQSDTRAPLNVAAKLGSPLVASSTANQDQHSAMSRNDVAQTIRGQDAVEELVTSTGSLNLGKASDRSDARATADDRPYGAPAPASQVGASVAGASQASDSSSRAGAPAPGLRTAVLSGGQTRSGSTPASRHSPAPSSSSMRSSSSSSVHRVGHTYSASSSSAASSSTSFLPASTPALTPLTPMHFSAAGASPMVSASPQSYFSVHPGDKRFANGQFAQTPMQHYPGQQPYPSHSSTFPNPAFPFLPSPHPGVPHMTSFHHHSPIASPSPQNGPDQHALFLQYQQQWQMEMLKNQQLQQAQTQEGRRRATSGPASHQSQSFYTTPQSYPPSPAASFQGHTLHSAPPAPTLPTLPPGAMLPQYAVHGYPTPPTSQESSSRGGSGGESSASSTGSAPPSRGEAYHPYRRDRDDPRRHVAGTQTGSFDSGRSAHAHRATPSNASSAVTRGHGRQDSSASTPPAGSPARQTPPRSESATSVHSMSSAQAGAFRHGAVPPSGGQQEAAFPRSRTNSSLSTGSGPSEAARSVAGPRHRQDSNDSGRSTTPVQFRSTRTSPLSAMPQNESEDDGAESDATAEATMTVNGGISASTTMTSIAGQAPDTKGKEKGGMKSRFKKAFGVSHSSSSATLTEADMAGHGPKQVEPGWRPRVDSDNMSEASTPPHLPYATHAGSISGGSILNDGASTTTSRRPPSSNKFRLLNGKFNGSSDNLSISSTVSSASMMIRKIGQMGKLARRNSLMGLTKAFKKNKDDDDDADAPQGTLAANKLSKKDKKKAGAAGASVSHATAESMSSAGSTQATAGMSPAAALARQQQLAYAEQEAAEERARRAAAAEAARLGPPKRSFEQLSTHQRTTSTASDASSIRSTQDKSGKSRKGFGFKNRFGLGGSKTDLRETASINGDAASTYSSYSAMAGRHEQYDDATPRQSLEVLAPPQTAYSSYGARELGSDSQEYEPSLYRDGAQPVSSSRSPRGILKGAGTYRQEDFVPPRPGYDRHRASSFDATRQQGSTAGQAALVNAIPSEQQVDGLAAMQTDHRSDIHPPSDKEVLADAVAARVHPETISSGPYSHTGMNASAPALNHFSSLPSLRTTSPPVAPKRRITFASSLSVHSTWPATVYDRRAEPATCNRLTPVLAQQIKEELNSFKMEEMAVHPLSRRLTHFFV